MEYDVLIEGFNSLIDDYCEEYYVVEAKSIEEAQECALNKFLEEHEDIHSGDITIYID